MYACMYLCMHVYVCQSFIALCGVRAQYNTHVACSDFEIWNAVTHNSDVHVHVHQRARDMNLA